MFKDKHKLLPKNILDLFSRMPSNHHLRNSDFNIPQFNSVRHGKHSLKFYGTQLCPNLAQMLMAFVANIRKRDLANWAYGKPRNPESGTGARTGSGSGTGTRRRTIKVDDIQLFYFS